MVWGIMDMLDTTATLMHITDIGEGKEDQLKPNQHQQLIQRLIPTICIEDTMDMDIPTDTMDMDMDIGEEKGDQQSLKQKPLLTPRLILTCCMEDITVLGTTD